MAVEFRIDDEPVDDSTHLVVVAGEIDLFTAPEFMERVTAPIDAGVRRVIVDLTEVSFIDSSSLGVLIGAHKRLVSEAGDGEGGIVVVCADRTILSAFKVTGLDLLFAIVPTREAAVTPGGPAS